MVLKADIGCWSTDYAIYMLDTGGHVSSWNSGANRFKGYTEAEILGEHFSRFYTPEDREAGVPQRALATAAKDGRFEAEVFARTASASGHMSSSMRSAIPLGSSSALPRSPETCQSEGSQRKSLREAKSSFDCWYRVRPTTPSTC